MKNIHGLMLVGCSALALAGCGPSDIASPGTGGNVVINNPSPTPTASPTPTGPATVTAAAACPSITGLTLSDQGTASGPTGTWRVCRLPSLINTSVSLPKVAGLVYELNGRVDVGCDGGFKTPTASAAFTSSTPGCSTPLTNDTNVTLTIDPGVIVIANTGTSWLAVNRGNKINAVGAANRPIIFTARANLTSPGDFSATSQGLWGGVVLMGRGITTDCTTGVVNADLTQHTCERQTEGATDPARFGGVENNYNAGRMSYVQIRYSGFILGSNVELQALTTEAIGTGTVLDHIQAHNSSDDGAEFFGGGVNLKYYIATGADDDSLDVDTGAQMNVQYALLLQRDGNGDALMEIDSNGNEANVPRTKLNVANFTAIQRQVSSNNEGNDQASVLLRGNSDTTWTNGLIVSPNNECLRMNGSGTTAATLVAKSVVMQCNATKYIGTGSYTAAQVGTQFGTGANGNNDAFTPTLSSLFINGANETAAPATDPKPVASFFDTTTWIGAVRNAADNWYTGWTCNSAIADFGTGDSGDCTTLPVT